MVDIMDVCKSLNIINVATIKYPEFLKIRS